MFFWGLFSMFNEDGTLRDSYLTFSNLRSKKAKESSATELSQNTFYWDKVITKNKIDDKFYSQC